MMKNIEKLKLRIKRVWIDFKCRVSEGEIDAYIKQHGKVLASRRFLDQTRDGVESANKPDRKAIRVLLESRKRREIFNNEVGKTFGDFGKEETISVHPYVEKTSEWADFKEAYLSTMPQQMLANYIISATKSLIFQTFQSVEVKARKYIKKRDKAYSDFREAYEDITMQEKFKVLGVFGSSRGLNTIIKSFPKRKDLPVKFKTEAKKVITLLLEEQSSQLFPKKTKVAKHKKQLA